MGKNKNIKNDVIFSEDDARNLLNQYKKLFDGDNSFYELELSILNYLKVLLQNIKDNHKQYNFSTILLMIKQKIMHAICKKIKQGDINLEINIIEQYIKHSNLIKPQFDNLVWNNAKREKYEKYKHLIQSYIDLEKKFIDKLWEDAIINSVETYQGNNLFTEEIIKNFKNKLPNVDIEFEQFTKNHQRISVPTS